MTEIDPILLEILVCPLSKAPLTYDKQTSELLCEASGLAYPVQNGIPVMLPEQARKIKTDT